MNRIFIAAILLGACQSAFSATPPTMGWSSWNTFALNINEELIKNQADAMIANGLDTVGYKFINIDDGFQDGRDKEGNLLINSKLFPGGMRSLVDYIHSKGLKAGIYSDAGNNTCGSQNKHKWGLVVGMAGHETADCKLFFKDWDFDYIKVDFCGGKRLGMDEQRQYSKIGRAIKNCGKPDVIYNICRWAYPGTWVSDVANSWRTTGDIKCSWKSIKNIILDNLYLQAYTGNGHYNDMDMLEVGRTLSPDEENTHFIYWCITSSPLIIGCDLATIPETSLALLKNQNLIAMNQDTLSLGAPVVQKQGDVYVVAKDVEKLHGPKRAVAVINLSDDPQTIDVDLASAGFGGKVSVFDCLMDEKLPDLAKDVFTVDLPPHGSKAFFFTGQRAEKTVYQAEEAFLPAYQELGKGESPTWIQDDTADGGVYITKLGGSENNCLVWNNVYSRSAGMYTLKIRYQSKKPAEMNIAVNGRPFKGFNNLRTGGIQNGWSILTVKVPLKAGNNTVMLYNSKGLMPDIDSMTLSKGNPGHQKSTM